MTDRVPRSRKAIYALRGGRRATLALVPATKPNLSQTDRLEITAADLTDALGRALDGNDDGQAGGNFSAMFAKQGIAFGQPSSRLDRADSAPVPNDRRGSRTETIDALLERDDMPGLTLSRRARLESRREGR